MDEQRFNPPPLPQTNGNESIVEALRREADHAEATAKRLRELAQAIESSSSENPLSAMPYETAPLDENGVPKYKGKKRGRKPKKRLRKRNPNAKKRAHTAYTLFVQETYPKIKQQHESAPATDGDQFQSKNIISLVAKQWKDVPADEKEGWKRRAKEITEQLEDSDEEGEEHIDPHEHVLGHGHGHPQVHGHPHEHTHPHTLPHPLNVHHATAEDVVDQLTNDHGHGVEVVVGVGHEHQHEQHQHEHQHQHGVGHGHGHEIDTHHEHQHLQGGVVEVTPAPVAVVHHHEGVHGHGHGHDEVVGDEGYYKESMQI